MSENNTELSELLTHTTEMEHSLPHMPPEHRKEIKEELRESRIVMARRVRETVMSDDSSREEEEERYRLIREQALRLCREAGLSDEEARQQNPQAFSTWEERQRQHELGMMSQWEPQFLRQHGVLEYRCKTHGCRLGGVLQVPDGRYWYRWSRVYLFPVVGSSVLAALGQPDVPDDMRDRLSDCLFGDGQAGMYQPRTIAEARWFKARLGVDYSAPMEQAASVDVVPWSYRHGLIDPTPYLRCPHVEVEVSPAQVTEDLRRVRGRRSPVVRL